MVDDQLNDIITNQLGIEGVAILGISASSGASLAGLQEATQDAFGRIIPGDIVTGIDGAKITDIPSLLSTLNNYEVGDEVIVQYWRNGESNEATVLLQSEH